MKSAYKEKRRKEKLAEQEAQAELGQATRAAAMQLMFDKRLFAVCRSCGAFVEDIDRHYDWHQERG